MYRKREDGEREKESLSNSMYIYIYLYILSRSRGHLERELHVPKKWCTCIADGLEINIDRWISVETGRENDITSVARQLLSFKINLTPSPHKKK